MNTHSGDRDRSEVELGLLVVTDDRPVGELVGDRAVLHDAAGLSKVHDGTGEGDQ